jgi:hypothetical protein
MSATAVRPVQTGRSSNIPCHFLEVNRRYYSDYVGFALWFYRKRQFPIYQIAWSNHENLYPRRRFLRLFCIQLQYVKREQPAAWNRRTGPMANRQFIGGL